MASEASEIPGWPQRLDDAPAIIYVLDGALRIVYCNLAWNRFAEQNGGAHLCRDTQVGRDVLALTPEPLKPFYGQLFRSVLETGVASDWVYECSSDLQFRRFHMHVARKKPPNKPPMLFVMNSLVIEESIEESHRSPGSPFSFERFRDHNGLISMCCHCRRTRLRDKENSWVWVPELVRRMPLDVSHGICPVCFDLHYLK
jgi:hypothetical protein